MDADSQRPKGRAGALSSLNMAIDALNLAKDVVDIAPAKAAFGSVSALLAMIRVRFCLILRRVDFGLTYIQDSVANEQEYVELGLSCADICRALARGNERKDTGRPQSVRVRGDKPADDVGSLNR
jgi:hypothetical protein